MTRIFQGILILASFMVFGERVSAQSMTADQVRGWSGDLDHLGKELPTRHKDLFYQLPQKDFEKRLATVKQQLADFSEPHAMFALAECIAAVDDGHTSLSLRLDRHQFFPLQFRWFKDGLFVSAASKALEKCVGARVKKFGKIRTKALLATYGKLISHDNSEYLKIAVPRYLQNASAADYLNVTGDSELTLQLEKEDADFMVNVPRLTLAELRKIKWQQPKFSPPLYLQKEYLSHWNEWLKVDQTIYFKYRRCQNALQLTALTNGTLGFIKQNDVRRLVIDMRLNGGGNSALFRPFLEAIKKDASLNRSDRLYLIIGRRTFSSAVLNTIEFKQETNATIIGLPTGGRPNHFGEIRSFELPHSKLKVYYSTKYFTHFQDGDPDSIRPDIQIEPTWKDWSSGRDPVMEYILKQPTAAKK